jgi:uncharacterized membrane protein YfcA
LFAAAVAAGVVNAVAGGGSLISFPALIAAGLPPVVANVTNTVALCPGYLGATFGQRRDLKGQRPRLRLLLPLAGLGGMAGALLLLNTSTSLFEGLVPWLILFGSALLAVQEPLKGWLNRRLEHHGHQGSPLLSTVPVFLAAVYGGYFGAGLSVIVLAVLALTLEDTLTRLNGLKQALAFLTNITSALLFLFSGQVAWAAVFWMASGAILGGALGGRMAGSIDPNALRWVVVVLGTAIGLLYLRR